MLHAVFDDVGEGLRRPGGVTFRRKLFSGLNLEFLSLKLHGDQKMLRGPSYELPRPYALRMEPDCSRVQLRHLKEGV